MQQLSAFMELLKQWRPSEAGVEGDGWGWAKVLLLGCLGFSQGPALAKLVMSHHGTGLRSEG